MSMKAPGRLVGDVKATLGFRDDGTRAWLRLEFVHLDGEPIDQLIDLVRVPTKVGGARWYATGIDVNGFTSKHQKLFLAPDGREFDTREAQGLHYGSLSTTDLYQRALKTASALGIADVLIPPYQKPAGMSDDLYDRLCRQLKHQVERWYCAALGRAPPNFGDWDDVRERE
jgi:hypothetical protein